MKSLLIFSIILTFLSCTAMANKEAQLPTVEYVSIDKYVGKWYSIYALPQRFTKNCLAQTADYEIIDEKTISVLNTCIKKKGETTINGKAVVSNARTNAELIVTFDNFFTRLFKVKGDYNIIALDNYDFVMIGSNDRDSMWMMSRTTDIPADILEKYLALAKSLGFDTSKLQKSKF
jgi:apolipoprotein D and lipocalin family protein